KVFGASLLATKLFASAQPMRTTDRPGGIKVGTRCPLSDQFRSRRAGYGQVGELIGFALAASPLRWGFIRGRLLPSVRQFGRTGLRSRLGVTATHNPKSRLVGA